MIEPDAAASRRPAGQSGGSGNLSATFAAHRTFPAAVAELGRSLGHILDTMKRFIVAFVATTIVAIPVALVASGFDLKVTNLGAGKVQVLATNIPSGIRGYCVWESSSNLVIWTPVVTNFVNKTWATNTFVNTNAMRFYRAWVY